MNLPDVRPIRQMTRPWLGVLLALGSCLVCGHAQAQQQSGSGAVESMQAVFDVAVVQQPRAGLYGITELMIAALHADVESARQLIDAGADVNETDYSESTPLMWAVHSGNVGIVNYLISQGANVDAKASQGATALINAISGKHEASAVALINAGANPNGRGNSRRNFLEAAAESGMADVVAALIANGVDVSTHGPSALSYALARRNKDCAMLLLDAGVDVNATVSDNTILYVAAKSGDIDMVRLLISRGADASQPDDYKSPLYPAVAGSHTAVAELLLDKGALANSNYVAIALRTGTADTATALLDRLDVNTFERVDVLRLLETADQYGQEDIVQRLLSASSAPQISDASVKLLYTRRGDPDCRLFAWDPQTNREWTAYADEENCAAQFFVADGTNTMFALRNSKIDSISLNGLSKNLVLDYPIAEINVRMQKLGIKFNEWLGGGYENLDASRAKPAAIGYLDGGEIGLATNTRGPADGIYAFLFGMVDGKWQLVAERSCGRMDSDCSFPQLNGRSIMDWPLQRTAWDPSIRKNPYFQDKENGISRFRFDGNDSLLKYITDTHGHCSGDCRYASQFELVLPNGQTQILSDVESYNSISENYVLLARSVRSSDNRWQTSIDLFDMKNGASLLGPMQLATWVD